jgi:hypothetical protein
MREISGKHDGTNLAEAVMEVVKEWNIQSNLGYFMMDNADNNDTMMREIAISMYLKLCFLILLVADFYRYATIFQYQIRRYTPPTSMLWPYHQLSR